MDAAVAAAPGQADHKSPARSRAAVLGGPAALTLIGCSLACFAVVMVLGPSAAVPKIGQASFMLWFDAHPPESVVLALERLGALAGALGTSIGLLAVRGGWRPSSRLLTVIGLVAVTVFMFLPPAGSTDVLNYASYGRIASLGHSPYLMTPAQLLSSGDPVGLLTPEAWRTAPTIYGPVATTLQWAAAELGGGSMAKIVFWIIVGKALAFMATGAALLWLAGSDQVRRIRIGLLWTANPLMLFWLVGSGHVDVSIALLTAVALIAIRRPGPVAGLLAGVLAGAAIGVKLTYAIVACGLVWPARRSVSTLATGIVAAIVTVGASYLWPGAASTATLRHRLSAGARFIFYLPHALAIRPALLTGLLMVATALVAVLLLRGLPPDDPGTPGVRLLLALAVASLAVLPVQTPWYDALIFVLLALMPASGFDYLLVARCLLLTEIVLPGVAPDAGIVSEIAAAVSHVGVFVLLALLVVVSLRPGRGAGQARAIPA